MRPGQALLLLLLLASAPRVDAGEAPVPMAGAIGMPPDAGAAPSLDFMKGVQRELKRAGYDPGLQDGKIGPATRSALRRFQEDQGLPATGNPDVPTLTRLLEQGLQR
jgi:hypothetical protein